jgi:selenocysteine lyase/cysteine desulfurase
VIPWERTRSFFPVTKELLFLDHAGRAPISTRVQEALVDWSERATRRGGFDAERLAADERRVRERAAELIGCRPPEIAFLPGAATGTGLVATGLDWRRGDVALLPAGDGRRGVLGRTLRSFGVQAREVRAPLGRLAPEDVEEALRDPRVRLLLANAVSADTGARSDLPALGTLCQERGVLFAVDASQGLGCLAVDVEAAGIDLLFAGGGSWLLAGEGTGLFFCSASALPHMRGWMSPPEARAGDARRFEPDLPDASGVARLGAALDLLLDLDLARIERRVLELTDHLVAALVRNGHAIASPRGDTASGIVCLRPDELEPADAVARLRERGILVAAAGDCLRVSPHFYNVEDELEAFVSAL